MRIVVAVFHRAADTGWLLLPYILAGVALGELLRFAPWLNVLTRTLRRNRGLALGLATVLGAVSPLCTYGTVPVVLRLFRAGVALPPLAAFLAASSLINPQLLIMTWGGLGPGLALARMAVTLCFGLLLGWSVRVLPREWAINPGLTDTETAAAGETSVPARGFTVRRFLAGCWSSLAHLGFYLVIGSLLGAGVEVLVPDRWLGVLLRPGRWYTVMLASLLGVPLYACGGGVIPLVRELVQRGMSPGAALGFFLVGQATRPAPLLALAALFRPRFILLYLGGLTAFAVLAGMIYH